MRLYEFVHNMSTISVRRKKMSNQPSLTEYNVKKIQVMVTKPFLSSAEYHALDFKGVQILCTVQQVGKFCWLFDKTRYDEGSTKQNKHYTVWIQ